jgi:hypothetical protein
MRRLGAVVVLAGAAALLSGCVYDPYTGAYYPCCSYYGNPAYRYPPAYYPPPQGYPSGPPPAQGYPSGPQPAQGYPYAPPPGQMPPPGQVQGSYQGQPLAPPPPGPGAAAYPRNGGNGGLAQRFASANVSHDGRLTREQAETAMPMVARNFDSIDIEHKGYVTLPEIRTFAAERRAAGQTATD